MKVNEENFLSYLNDKQLESCSPKGSTVWSMVSSDFVNPRAKIINTSHAGCLTITTWDDIDIVEGKLCVI